MYRICYTTLGGNMPTGKEVKKMTVWSASERIFHKCNLIGENCDVIAVMMQYKAVRELPEKEFDELYDYIVERLGFTR